MGWIFRRVSVEYDIGYDAVAMHCGFRCACGEYEALRQAYGQFELHDATPEMLERMFDPAAVLRKLGSFSREHLLADGYTEAQVAEFARKGREFDEQNS